MLENINDWLSLFSIVAVLVMVIGSAIHMINLNMISRHIRQEEEYYRNRAIAEPEKLAKEKLSRQEKRRIN
jgi:phosphate/sulfate permease